MTDRLLELARAFNAAVRDADAIRTTRDRLADALHRATDELTAAHERQFAAQRALLIEAGQD